MARNRETHKPKNNQRNYLLPNTAKLLLRFKYQYQLG